MASMTKLVSLSSKELNKNECYSIFLILTLSVSVLGTSFGLKSVILLWTPNASAETELREFLSLL